MKTVILDNYDSFTFNLYQYVGELDAAPLVFRNDAISVQRLADLAPDRIILSPGPGDPTDQKYFGICQAAILQLGKHVPTLGVCLGHQGIIHAFGGRIIRTAPMHGKTSYVFHDDVGIFQGLPRAFQAMRYHSLVGDPLSIPDCLEVIARTSDNVVMGIRHCQYPIHGVQFHPESIGTEVGKQLLRNFLEVGSDVTPANDE
ncbi:MAG: aminodeoxychorismate/anthranilate synthase component II [Planctomycetota bacterium]|nr:aminodeoxychorismate/anthranilate synthase component II [Planctomycetota bacterium]